MQCSLCLQLDVSLMVVLTMSLLETMKATILVAPTSSMMLRFSPDSENDVQNSETFWTIASLAF